MGEITIREPQVADCQWPQSRAHLKPETMRVTFEEFSPTHDFFDYRRFSRCALMTTARLAASSSRFSERF